MAAPRQNVRAAVEAETELRDFQAVAECIAYLRDRARHQVSFVKKCVRWDHLEIYRCLQQSSCGAILERPFDNSLEAAETSGYRSRSPAKSFPQNFRRHFAQPRKDDRCFTVGA